MSVRSSASTAPRRPHLDNKQRSSGWGWPRLVNAEPPSSTSEASLPPDVTVDSHSSALGDTVKAEGMPDPSEIPAGSPTTFHSTSTVFSPGEHSSSDAGSSSHKHGSTDHSLSQNSISHGSDHGLPNHSLSQDTTSLSPEHGFADHSSSHDTIVSKVCQWEAAKTPQLHEPAAAYRSERTSIADVAPSGAPLSLAQIMALPQAGTGFQSSGSAPVNDGHGEAQHDTEPDIDYDKKALVDTDNSIFPTLARSEGSETHSETKEDPKKEIKEHSTSIADTGAEELPNQPSSPIDARKVKIFVIRATSESCEPVTDHASSVCSLPPERPLPRAPIEDPFEDPILCEDLGQIKVPVQGMIPRMTRIVRRGRCVVLRKTVLQALLGRELAKQTQPVLRLMAHGIAVQELAQAEAVLPRTIFDMTAATPREAHDFTASS